MSNMGCKRIAERVILPFLIFGDFPENYNQVPLQHRVEFQNYLETEIDDIRINGIPPIETPFTEESIAQTNNSISAVLRIFRFILQEFEAYIDAHPPGVNVYTPRLFSLHPNLSHSWKYMTIDTQTIIALFPEIPRSDVRRNYAVELDHFFQHFSFEEFKIRTAMDLRGLYHRKGIASTTIISTDGYTCHVHFYRKQGKEDVQLTLDNLLLQKFHRILNRVIWTLDEKTVSTAVLFFYRNDRLCSSFKVYYPLKKNQ